MLKPIYKDIETLKELDYFGTHMNCEYDIYNRPYKGHVFGKLGDNSKDIYVVKTLVRGNKIFIYLTEEVEIAAKHDFRRIIAEIKWDVGVNRWFACEPNKFMKGKICTTRFGKFEFIKIIKVMNIYEYIEWKQNKNRRSGLVTCQI